jgi:hypothetical protein
MSKKTKSAVRAAADAAVAKVIDKTPPGQESLVASALQGRIMMALLGIVTLWSAFDTWWAKVGPYLEGGLTAQEAMDALQTAGPMLSAWDNVLTMITGASIAGLAVWSKAKDWLRSRRQKPTV